MKRVIEEFALTPEDSRSDGLLMVLAYLTNMLEEHVENNPYDREDPRRLGRLGEDKRKKDLDDFANCVNDITSAFADPTYVGIDRLITYKKLINVPKNCKKLLEIIGRIMPLSMELCVSGNADTIAYLNHAFEVEGVFEVSYYNG